MDKMHTNFDSTLDIKRNQKYGLPLVLERQRRSVERLRVDSDIDYSRLEHTGAGTQKNTEARFDKFGNVVHTMPSVPRSGYANPYVYNQQGYSPTHDQRNKVSLMDIQDNYISR